MLAAAGRLGANPHLGDVRPALSTRYRFWSLTRYSYVLVYDPATRPVRYPAGGAYGARSAASAGATGALATSRPCGLAALRLHTGRFHHHPAGGDHRDSGGASAFPVLSLRFSGVGMGHGVDFEVGGSRG